jgi:hypothetical protein
MILEKWTLKDMSDETICFTKAWIESWNDSCELDHMC